MNFKIIKLSDEINHLANKLVKTRSDIEIIEELGRNIIKLQIMVSEQNQRQAAATGCLTGECE